MNHPYLRFQRWNGYVSLVIELPGESAGWSRPIARYEDVHIEFHYSDLHYKHWTMIQI